MIPVKKKVACICLHYLIWYSLLRLLQYREIGENGKQNALSAKNTGDLETTNNDVIVDSPLFFPQETNNIFSCETLGH